MTDARISIRAERLAEFVRSLGADFDVYNSTDSDYVNRRRAIDPRCLRERGASDDRLFPLNSNRPETRKLATLENNESRIHHANNEIEARTRVAKTLDNGVAADPDPNGPRYQKITPAPSPWEIKAVTSCEVYTSGTCDGHHVVADDGKKWPIKYKVRLLHNSVKMS